MTRKWRSAEEIRSINRRPDSDVQDGLEYFLTTDAVRDIESGKILLVLGRKGSGKTALVKHFTATQPTTHGQPLSLRSYPWTTHAALVDKGASETEAYVASWRLLIAIRLASMVVELGSSKYTDTLEGLRKFLFENFGTIRPETRSILSRPKLKVVGLSVGPQIGGFSVGSITFGDPAREKVLGLELDSLANSILVDVSNAVAELNIQNLYLHFDELDQGLDLLDDTKKRMLIGLILAARDIKRSTALRANISPIVYLRTDIWEQVSFSDKNKITRGAAIRLAWNETTLKELIEARLVAMLGVSISWSDIEDGAKMRGSQGKLQHMLSRTLLRPRDVIQFLNEALKVALARPDDHVVFINEDFNQCRQEYSEYLKDELADEIDPHWAEWTDGLRACSKTETITFQKEDFLRNYKKIRSKTNPLDGEAALEQLYRFSIVGYLRPSAGGGSSWSFRYSDENAGWDAAASRLKVHIGLKEHAQLKEDRVGRD